MDYELAKSLKEAGFPQAIKEDDFYFMDGGTSHWHANIPTDFPHDRMTKDVSLEELIEACGDGYFMLEHTQHDWRCWMGLNPRDGGLGSTPTEAVARLWLALNKKEIIN